MILMISCPGLEVICMVLMVGSPSLRLSVWSTIDC
jgi:hypothetical protein